MSPSHRDIPDDFRGVWQRTLLQTDTEATHPPASDSSSWVRWMQTSLWHGDLRIPESARQGRQPRPLSALAADQLARRRPMGVHRGRRQTTDRGGLADRDPVHQPIAADGLSTAAGVVLHRARRSGMKRAVKPCPFQIASPGRRRRRLSTTPASHRRMSVAHQVAKQRAMSTPSLLLRQAALRCPVTSASRPLWTPATVSAPFERIARSHRYRGSARC